MAGNTTNIGIPPYIQSNTSGDTFNNNTYDPETGTEMQALNRKQQIANLLVQQSLAPRQGQMIGNVYVGPGIGQGIAQLGQALAGAYMTRRHDKKRSELQDQNQQNVANAMQAYQESQQGRPALTVPEGSQGPERPAMPATPEDQRAGLVRLMTNQNPQVQRFAQYEAQRQAKAAEMKAAQDQAMALEAAKARSAAQLKGIPSADAQAQLAQQAQLHAAPSGNTLAQIEAKKQELATVPAATQAQIDAKKAELATVPAAVEAQIASQQQMHAAPSGTALAGIDAQAALQNATLQQRQAEQAQAQQQESAKLAQAAELKKAELAQAAQLHAAPSGNTLATIDAQGAMQNATLQQRQAEFEQKKQQDIAELDLKKGQFANQADYQKAQLALQAKHQQEQAALQRELHATPSGNALANVDAQAQISLQQHNDRKAQLDQNARQDQASLELRRQQGLSETEYKRDKLQMEDRHAKQQAELTKEKNDIMRQFHVAQTAKGAGKVDDAKEKANYNAGLKEVAQDQKSVESANALQGDLQRWQELQDKVETGPIAGRRPISFNPDYQELKQLENRLAINNFKPGQGQISNFERTLIKGAGPSTLNDAATNKNIVQIMLGGMQNMKERADFKEWYLEQHGKMLGADKAWNEYVDKNPRFTKDKAGQIIPNQNRPDWMSYFSGEQTAPAAPGNGEQTASSAPMPQGKAPVKITGDADYNALPDGADYIDPNGQPRTKGKRK